MAKKQSTQPTPQRQTSAMSMFGRIFRGQIVSSDFFARYWYVVLIAVCLPMVYITTKYECQTNMEEIRRLEHELEIVKTERIRARSLYMSRTRESSMNQLVDSLHLNLRVQETPPFKISSKK